MKAKNQAENKELCKQNLHSQQVPFDAVDATLALMFRTDAEINKAFGLLDALQIGAHTLCFISGIDYEIRQCNSRSSTHGFMRGWSRTLCRVRGSSG